MNVNQSHRPFQDAETPPRITVDRRFKTKDEVFAYELGFTLYPFVPGCGHRPGNNAAWMGHMDAKRASRNEPYTQNP